MKEEFGGVVKEHKANSQKAVTFPFTKSRTLCFITKGLTYT